MISVRRVNNGADYPKLKLWWELRKFPPAIQEFMPPTGFMVQWNGQDICAGFLFISDARVACMANFVSDPAVEKEVRSQCVDRLIEELVRYSKRRGMGLLTCSTNLKSVMARFEKHGFIKTDVNVSSFGRLL